MQSRNRTPTDVLPVIYLAMAGGVALFAVVLLLALPPPEGEPQLALRLGWLGAAGGGLLAGRVVRARFERGEREPMVALRTAVLVWALAEGPAFVGLVFYMLTGDRVLLLATLAVFAWAMLRNPPAAFRPPSRS